MMLGAMEGFYCREVCFFAASVGKSHRRRSPSLTRARACAGCLPYFHCFGPGGPLSAPLVCTAATDFTDVEGVEHVLSLRLSAEPRRTAAIFKASETGTAFASEDHVNSFRLGYVPVPRLRLGAFARSSVFLIECDRAELTLQLCLQGSSRRAEIRFALISVFATAYRGSASPGFVHTAASASRGSGFRQVAGHRKREEDTPGCDNLRSVCWASSLFAEVLRCLRSSMTRVLLCCKLLHFEHLTDFDFDKLRATKSEAVESFIERPPAEVLLILVSV